ncbi:hypothetical protein EPUL_006710, partial [Erysiphe pulchra]
MLTDLPRFINQYRPVCDSNVINPCIDDLRRMGHQRNQLFDYLCDLKKNNTTEVFSLQSISPKIRITTKFKPEEANVWQSNTFNVSPGTLPSVDQIYPTTRRPHRRELSSESEDTVNLWFQNSKIEIGPMCPESLIPKVKRLLYTYRDLNAVEISDVTPTDIFTHRVRLVPGTKPFRARIRKRWTSNEQFWINKTVSEGLKCGLFERTIEANGKFSDWNANPRPAEKSGTSGPNPELRFAVDYSHIEEQMPGCSLSLTEEVHDYLSFPGHKVFCQFDLKHAYWAFPLHPDDRYIFAFFIPNVGQLQPCAMPQGTKSACFSMNEGMLRLWGEIPPLPKEIQPDNSDGSEPSLLGPGKNGEPAIIAFYMDDSFHGSDSAEKTFEILEYHILPRLAWSRFKLSFKKLKLFMDEITALGMIHKIGGISTTKYDRTDKIKSFPIPQDVTA